MGNGSLSTPAVSDVAIGSLEGNGIVSLDHSNLTVGSNNLDPSFRGRFEGMSSILIKVGIGTLTLRDTIDFAIINRGKLLVNKTSPFGGFMAVLVVLAVPALSLTMSQSEMEAVEQYNWRSGQGHC